MAKDDIFEANEDFKEAIASMMTNMSVYINSMFVKAKLCRAYHQGLIKEGFTEAEALELCKTFTTQL